MVLAAKFLSTTIVKPNGLPFHDAADCVPLALYGATVGNKGLSDPSTRPPINWKTLGATNKCVACTFVLLLIAPAAE